MIQHYPKWLYHKTEAALIVQSEEEHQTLGPGWEEAPIVKNGHKEDSAPEKIESHESSSVVHEEVKSEPVRKTLLKKKHKGDQ